MTLSPFPIKSVTNELWFEYMNVEVNFIDRLDRKVTEQLRGQRVGYLLGAGSSHLDGVGYPLASELWDLIKVRISDKMKRDEIQAKLDAGATGIEQALDLLDSGQAVEGPHRHLVISAIAELFESLNPPLDQHIEFVTRISHRADPSKKIFSLNYDPLVERAAERARVRLWDGFGGHEHAYFDASIFEERIGRIRGTYKARRFEETTKPIHLLKLHGSLGWYECDRYGVRRCAFSSAIPSPTKRLMIPPQQRKASDTMTPPYSALWSAFRGCLGQDAIPINRLACFGYGLMDEHVNVIIDSALGRPDFTLLIFTKLLTDTAWARWCNRKNVVIVTETRCAIKGEEGPGHSDLWSFARIVKEV